MNSKRKQQFFQIHETDITCLDIYKDKIAATGSKSLEKNKLASIYLWDVEYRKVLGCLKGFHINSVIWVKFSPNGKKLLTVG
jgi:WD40 repeat protein